MSDNFKTDTLDSLCELIVDCPHSTPTWTTFGYVVIRNQNITDGVLDLSSPSYTDYSGYRDRTKRASPQENDIVITREAPMGRVCLIPKEPICCLGQRQVLLRADRNKISAEYLYWSLRSPFVQRQILINEGTGATVSNMRIPVLKALEIPRLASIEIENKKAKDLSNIQNKIQLNTQINQTLEQIAQALFKSWFVDFDPVRAKVQALSDGLSLEQAELAAMQAISGKTPEELTALSQTQPERYAELAETAKAFPCEMEEIDGVEVPKGWEVKPLPEIIDFLEGPGIRNWQYTEEEDGIKFINIRCIQNGDLTLTTANKITKEEAFGKYKHFQLEEDDIVVSTSGTLGRFAFVRKEHLPLSLNTSVIRFRPIKNKSTLGFIAGFVENQLQHELEIRASGSAQRNFGPTHLKQISLLLPNFKLLELHQKYASSLFEKRKQLLSEIDVLKDTRDLLLPKLLNGEFIKWKT